MLLLNNLFQNALIQFLSIIRLPFFFFFLFAGGPTLQPTRRFGPQCSLYFTQMSYQHFREDAVYQILRGDIWRTWELSQPSECSVYSESISILIVYEQWWRENVKALRDLGERIWLHLCPIKQLAGSRGMPNIYLYLVASLHLSAYGFMTSKLFWKKKKKGASRQSQWLITKADRDGRQTHTHTDRRNDKTRRQGTKESKSDTFSLTVG